MDNQSVSKHEHNEGTRIRARRLNNRELDLGARSPDKQVGIITGQTAGETDSLFALFALESTHTLCQHDLVSHSYSYTSDLPGTATIYLDKEQIY